MDPACEVLITRRSASLGAGDRAGVAILKTRTIRNRSELIAHFNQAAAAYAEAHRDGARLLEYRLQLILRCCKGRSGVLLEIGCGTALHLAMLAPASSRLIGTDMSREWSTPRGEGCKRRRTAIASNCV
jgi:hypothetical protein